MLFSMRVINKIYTSFTLGFHDFSINKDCIVQSIIMMFVGFSIHYIILRCASVARNLLPAEKNLIGKKP